MLKLKFNLFQKGLLLVFILLSFELLFVGGLAVLLIQSEREAERLQRSNDIIDKTNKLLQQLNEINMVFGHRGLSFRTLNDPRYKAAEEQIPGQFQTLRELVKNNPEKLKLLNRAEMRVNQCHDILLTLKEDLAARPPPFVLISIMGDTNRNLKFLRDKAYQDLIAFIKQDQQIAEAAPQAQARTRELQKQFLAAGLVLNMMIAIVMVLFFSRGITARLATMMDNTLRLSRRETLNPPVQGSDEIAQLDKVFHDVAEALVEADRKEQELQKLKREFVAMASHELRTPLTSVQGTLTLLIEGVYGELPDKATEKLRKAESNIARLIALINDVLDIEKIQAGRLSMQVQPVVVSDIVEKAISAVSDFAQERQIPIRYEGDDVRLCVDPDRITQVLVNFLSNAIKFSPAQSEVRVQFKALAEPVSMVEVSVSDQGPGVAPESQTLIFERFQQADAASEAGTTGSGLGLAISKAIVEQHGGTIGVDSKPGEGSRFWFRVNAT